MVFILVLICYADFCMLSLFSYLIVRVSSDLSLLVVYLISKAFTLSFPHFYCTFGLLEANYFGVLGGGGFSIFILQRL